MTQTDVDRLAESARELGRLGLDTEFMPEGRYRPLLCLVQIVVGEQVEVLDPLVGHVRPDAAGRGARRPGDRDRAARRPPGRGDPAARVEDDVHERLRHAGRRGLRRLLRAGRLQRPAARRAADPAAEDRELHALGRAAADRRADLATRAATSSTCCRWPTTSSARLVDARPARVGARGVRGDRRGDRRARPRRGLAPAAARERAGPARARRRAGARRPGASARRRREDRPVGAILRDPTVVELAKRQPDRPPRARADPRHHARRRAPPRRRRDGGDRASAARPSRSGSRRATARRPRPSTARRSRSPSRSCARARRRPGWPTS